MLKFIACLTFIFGIILMLWAIYDCGYDKGWDDCFDDRQKARKE